MSKILLSAHHIVQYFGEQKILEFEKLTVYEGDRIGIVGTNGAGKTTLLNILSGELVPDEGTVTRAAGEKMEKLDSARKTILSRLEQLEAKEKPQQAALVHIDFSLTDPPANREIATGSHVTFGYGNNLIFENTCFSLPKGSKTALIGPNGAGKTTLMELIRSGAPGIRLVPKAKIGYFQQSLDALDPDKAVLENVMETSVQSESTMRDILARFLIRREDVFKKAGVLSGGERVKLAFAKLFSSPANLLFLDEPTNFLDMPAIEALQKMVQDYEGTVLFVSHDRAFSDACATRILRIENRKLLAFDGNLTAWENKQAEAKTEKKIDKVLLELRLADVISRLSLPGCENKEELEKEFEQLLAQKRTL